MTGQPLLLALGRRVRALRSDRGLTLNQLAEAARLSPRFLHELEAGRGNISVLRLAAVAESLGVAVDRLLRDDEGAAPARAKIALIGLRGAGKTTIGRRVARQLKVPFIELDREIERRAGMPLADLFGIHGEADYRRHEREAVRELAASPGPAVVAAGGGVVTEPDTFALLLDHCFTVWLEAKPDEHWNRVIAQGDQRPMQDHPAAMARLRAILKERRPLYRRAHLRVDTSKHGVDGTVRAIVAAARARR